MSLTYCFIMWLSAVKTKIALFFNPISVFFFKDRTRIAVFYFLEITPALITQSHNFNKIA